jgi:CheY-like chemotaxis protein/anti-sigma regulatory factor (Ser/Thr protein kinase)
VTLQEVAFDLPRLLTELAETFGLTARQKGLRLSVEHAPDVPRYVIADEVKLRQVLVNLLSNALKFTRDGGVTLNVTAVGDDRLAFRIADSGPGIAPEELAKLGTAFVQAQVGTESGQGTGLGLAISRGFVQALGGELRLSSEVGRGTIVEFEIRAPAAAPAAEPERAKDRRPVGLAPGQPAFRILAVDDRVDGRLLLRRLLEPLGFEVREACDGAAALAEWEQWRPHLVFMDMRMPIMDGREAVRRIKATPQGRQTVVIALTASSFQDEREAILAEGCDEFLRKPFREETLFDMMRRHLHVEFVYENNPAASPETVFSPGRLADLPAETCRQLEAALRQMDVNGIAHALDRVRQHDVQAARMLEEMADMFQYERMLELLPDTPENDGAV